jgi:hypothetical protein
MGADVRGRGDRPPVHELGIVDAHGKHDDVPMLAGPELGREPLAEIRRRLAHNAEVIEERAQIIVALGAAKQPPAQPLHPATLRIPGAVGKAVPENKDFVHRLQDLPCVVV